MSNVIWLSLFIVLMLVSIVLYIVILIRSRRGSVAVPPNWGLDWVSLLATVFGGVALGLLLAFGISFERLGPWILLIIIPFLLLAVLLLILPRRVLIGIIKPGATVDERLVAIGAKSARNALLVTYLALVAFIIKNADTLDRNSLIIVLASGLLVFYASYFFYYYRKS